MIARILEGISSEIRVRSSPKASVISGRNGSMPKNARGLRVPARMSAALTMTTEPGASSWRRAPIAEKTSASSGIEASSVATRERKARSPDVRRTSSSAASRRVTSRKRTIQSPVSFTRLEEKTYRRSPAAEDTPTVIPPDSARFCSSERIRSLWSLFASGRIRSATMRVASAPRASSAEIPARRSMEGVTVRTFM